MQEGKANTDYFTKCRKIEMAYRRKTLDNLASFNSSRTY